MFPPAAENEQFLIGQSELLAINHSHKKPDLLIFYQYESPLNYYSLLHSYVFDKKEDTKDLEQFVKENKFPPPKKGEDFVVFSIEDFVVFTIDDEWPRTEIRVTL